MKRLFARIVTRATHLSDETISMLVSAELKPSHEARADVHLAKCWQCRGRRDAFEKAALQVVGYRKARLEAELPLDSDRRGIFLAQLDRMLTQSVPVSPWTKMLDRLQSIHLPIMNPIAASSVIVCIAIIALCWVWQRHPVTVNAAQLLRRAAASDTAISLGKSGVVYQRVRITTSRLNVERELYRDVEGKRHRLEPLQVKSDSVKDLLTSSGVNWEAPLSAASYREWHDAQTTVSDEVAKTGGDLLTLTTKISDDRIQEETLTVRISDFHPVERTIRTVSQGTIEIAELNYAVLGWNAVNESLFDNPNSLLASPHLADGYRIPASSVPTPMQIDSAELQVRIALNRSGADVQDQIAISHSDAGVVVKGIVATTQRKRDLVSSLRMILYVHPEILSTEELTARQIGSQTSATSVSELPSNSTEWPSPLAAYIGERGFSREQLDQASRHLLSASLALQQRASLIAELQERFSPSEGLGPQANANLQALLTTYSESLIDALHAEAAALSQIGLVPSGQHEGSLREASPEVRTLKQQVRQNQLLCQELIAASPSAPRSADAIATALQISINNLETALAVMQKQSR